MKQQNNEIDINSYPKGRMLLTNTGMLIIGLIEKSRLDKSNGEDWPVAKPMMVTPTQEGAELRDLPVVETEVLVRDHAVVWTAPIPDKLWDAYIAHITAKEETEN